jgi:hypothetical protein
MNKETKSLINSLLVILLYYYALQGLVRLFWFTNDQDMFKGRVHFLGILLILVTLIGVIVPYHVFPMSVTNVVYHVIIFFHLFILLIGCFNNVLKG